MTYLEPSDEVIAQVRALFNPVDSFSLLTGKGGYHIYLQNEYSYVGFDGMSTLMGYMRIAELLGVKNGDEESRIKTSSGCPTCGYGGSYEVELRFW